MNLQWSLSHWSQSYLCFYKVYERDFKSYYSRFLYPPFCSLFDVYSYFSPQTLDISIAFDKIEYAFPKLYVFCVTKANLPVKSYS